MRWFAALLVSLIAGHSVALAQNAPKAGEAMANAATPVKDIKVAKGFRVELLYSVPRQEQGSWVSMCLDPQGG